MSDDHDQAEVRDALRDIFQEGFFLERIREQVEAIDPDHKPPSWMTEELSDALNAIPGPHERKKRVTVLRMAEAEASGSPVIHVFKSQDCCTAPIWYGRQKPFVKVGWRDLPEIAEAYDIAKRRAHWWYDQAEEERLMARRQVVARTQDRLAEVAMAAAEVLFNIMTTADNPDVQRKAAVDVLTHAAEETAPKSRGSQKIDLEMTATGPTMNDIRNRRRRLPQPQEDEAMVPVPVQEQMDSTGEEGPPPPPPGGLRIPKINLDPPPPNGDGEETEDP